MSSSIPVFEIIFVRVSLIILFANSIHQDDKDQKIDAFDDLEFGFVETIFAVLTDSNSATANTPIKTTLML